MSHRGSAQLHSLPLLSRLEGDKGSARVWHRAYTCSGIKYCPQVNPKIFLSGQSGIPFDDYNRVNLEYFKFLWRHRKYAYDNLGPKDILKKKTEEFYTAFLYNWEQGAKDTVSSAPCLYNGHYTCPYDVPILFKRNKVCVFHQPSVRKVHANDRFRLNLLAAQRTQTLRHGIWLNRSAPFRTRLMSCISNTLLSVSIYCTIQRELVSLLLLQLLDFTNVVCYNSFFQVNLTN
jgi:hypothetical protein